MLRALKFPSILGADSTQSNDYWDSGIFPKLKDKLRSELKKEWGKQVKDNEASLQKREERAKKRRPAETEELEKFLRHYPDLKPETVEDLKRNCDALIEERAALRNMMEQRQAEHFLTSDSFDKMFDESVSFKFCVGVKTSKGPMDKVVVDIDETFAFACRQDHMHIQDRIQKIACDFMRGKGFKPEKYSPCVSTQLRSEI